MAVGEEGHTVAWKRVIDGGAGKVCGIPRARIFIGIGTNAVLRVQLVSASACSEGVVGRAVHIEGAGADAPGKGCNNLGDATTIKVAAGIQRSIPNTSIPIVRGVLLNTGAAAGEG